MGCGSSSTAVKEANSVKSAVRQKNGGKSLRNSDYDMIDKHARNAPDKLRSSPENLINYLSTPSKEPKMVTRAIFVWISENISYDLDGLQGKTARKPCDAESVMKSGSCVCEGFANVMQLLCSTANIPVQKISGHAKGLGYSADSEITLKSETNHAWNAVQLDGKWYLMDSTWGAGHVDASNKVVKEFDDFYFMADPKKLISSHFPYMDNDLAASMKWQLLNKPVSLEEFNRNIRIRPNGFKLGITPISHTKSVIKMQNEVEVSFKTDVKNVTFSSELWHKDGNMLRSLPYNTFNQYENGIFKSKIHPNKKGKYRYQLFGKEDVGDKDGNNSMPQLLEYEVDCTETANTDFEYPEAYTQAQIDKCILVEPLRGNIPANTPTKFSVKATGLLRVMVGQTFLDKKGTTFEGEVVTGPEGTGLSMYGSKETSGMLGGLYQFRMI